MDAEEIARSLRALGLSGEVVDRDHPAFDTARRVWNAIADRRPAAIVRAESEADVVATVRLAAKAGVLLAVRGGGHSLPGLSTCDDGIVLDLSRMNGVRIDPASRRATVGGGALLGDLDRAGAVHGLVVPAGVVAHTGVGGLTLGGGMGWLSRRFGLSVDSIERVRMVLADGRAVDVDAASEPELFWGIRGGGGNFGVVVEFTFRTHDLGTTLLRSWDFAPSDAGSALREFGIVAATAPRHVTMLLVLVGPALSIAVLSSGPTATDDDFTRFDRTGVRPVRVSTELVSFVELQSRSDEHARWGRRWYSKGGFLHELDVATVGRMTERIAGAPSDEAEIYAIQLGGAVADVDVASTAYVGRDAGWYTLAEPIWDDPADDDRNIAWGRATAAALAEGFMPGNYVNEQADADASVARSAYGQATYRRLAELKRAVDPNNVFRLNQNILPAPVEAAATAAPTSLGAAG